MQAKFPKEKVSGSGFPTDLYRFWGKKIAEELCRDEDVIVNLASKEYSRCVSDWLPDNVLFAEVVFGEISEEGKVREKGTYAKMARGEMVNYMAGRQITDLNEICGFDRLSFRYDEKLSSCNRYVFLRRENRSNKPG